MTILLSKGLNSIALQSTCLHIMTLNSNSFSWIALQSSCPYMIPQQSNCLNSAQQMPSPAKYSSTPSPAPTSTNPPKTRVSNTSYSSLPITRSRLKIQLDGGHIGPVLFLFFILLFAFSVLMCALRDMNSFYCNRPRPEPPSFLCPQGLKYVFFSLVVASIVTINKHLDVKKNLTCPPTLSYDKGIAYS